MVANYCCFKTTHQTKYYWLLYPIAPDWNYFFGAMYYKLSANKGIFLVEMRCSENTSQIQPLCI